MLWWKMKICTHPKQLKKIETVNPKETTKNTINQKVFKVLTLVKK